MTEGMRFTTPRHREVYVAYGTVYDCVDALAAILFIVGSVLFFGAATQTAGTWLASTPLPLIPNPFSQGRRGLRQVTLETPST